MEGVAGDLEVRSSFDMSAISSLKLRYYYSCYVSKSHVFYFKIMRNDILRINSQVKVPLDELTPEMVCQLNSFAIHL